MTGNFFSPNLERQKSRPSASPVIIKDSLNSYQQRLQRFATAEAEVENQTNKDREPLVAKHEVWTGVSSLKPGSSSARARNIQKPLSPQLDKKFQDRPVFKDNLDLILAADHSYLKRVKQVLQERTQSNDKYDQPLPPAPSLEDLNLKKLKEITSGKNLFISSALLGGDNKNKRAPLGEHDQNVENNKPSSARQKDADTSSNSISKDKSISLKQKHSPLSPLTLFQTKLAEQMEETQALLDSRHNEMLEINPDQLKPAKIKLLAQTQETIYSIYNMITQDKDPYETIRSYSDNAQDTQFNAIENIFKTKHAKMLFSRLLKIERWLVVYLFYFTIQDNNVEKNKIFMLELSDLLFKNMSFIVSWICRASESANRPFESMFKNVSVQVSISQFRANTFFDAAITNVKTILQKLSSVTKDLNKHANTLLAKFIESIDRWSLNKCFEKGFECFYDTFIQKGVISVSFQDKENSQPKIGNGNNNVAVPGESNSAEASKKDTPNKEVLFNNIQEELPLERKSFGDKLIIQELRDYNGFHKHVDKIDSPFFLFQPDTHKVKQKKPLLPAIRTDRDYTLVLDLDETLIHFEENPDGTSQFLIRPFAQNFLKEISKYYEIVIFTAALKDYADFILDRLDTEGVISHRLYRNNCSFSENVYQKDLTKLGRDLAKTLIVDNNAENFQQQPNNGIYIRSWYKDPNDEALKKLAPLLVGKSSIT